MVGQYPISKISDATNSEQNIRIISGYNIEKIYAVNPISCTRKKINGKQYFYFDFQMFKMAPNNSKMPKTTGILTKTNRNNNGLEHQKNFSLSRTYFEDIINFINNNKFLFKTLYAKEPKYIIQELPESLIKEIIYPNIIRIESNRLTGNFKKIGYI